MLVDVILWVVGIWGVCVILRWFGVLGVSVAVGLSLLSFGLMLVVGVELRGWWEVVSYVLGPVGVLVGLVWLIRTIVRC